MRRMKQAGGNRVARAFWAEIRQGIAPEEALLQEPRRRVRGKHRLVQVVDGRVERR